METVILMVTTGILVGYLLRKHPKIIRITEKMTGYTIYLLLFLMGISVGLNDQVIRHFDAIGIQAASVAAGSVAGSVVVCWLLYLLLFRRKNTTVDLSQKPGEL